MMKRELDTMTLIAINDGTAIAKRKNDGVIEISKENYKGDLEELFFTAEEFEKLIEAYFKLK